MAHQNFYVRNSQCRFYVTVFALPLAVFFGEGGESAIPARASATITIAMNMCRFAKTSMDTPAAPTSGENLDEAAQSEPESPERKAIEIEG